MYGRRPFNRFGFGGNRFGGGFIAPFLLGGITGGLLAPAFYGPRPFYGPVYYGPRPFYY